MEITEALIDRFFKGECSSEEAEAVLTYLESDPAAKEKYFGKKEWDEALASESILSAGQSARMLAHIQLSLFQKPPKKFISSYIAIAASLIIIAGAFLFWSKVNTNFGEVAKAKHKEAWKVVSNTGPGVKRFSLADGSYVELDPNSEFSIPVQFRQDRREVKLNGRALFNVAKDKQRPFTVFADKTATTALGTKFIVDAGKGLQTIAVRLLEGKVLIKVPKKTSKAVMHYYLIPRQELIYAKGSGMIIIQRVATRVHGLPKSEDKHVPKVTRTHGHQFSFSREPVSTVFRSLSAAFEVQINFPDSGLDDNYFTGSFSAADSLERMLQVISKTNNLMVTKTKTGYLIQKRTN